MSFFLVRKIMDTYQKIVSRMRKGQRPVPLLKSIDPDLYKDLYDKVGKDLTSEYLYRYFFPSSQVLCLVCGEPNAFENFRKGFFRNYCSQKCGNSSLSPRRCKAEQTMLIRFGAKNIMQSVEGKKRLRSTMDRQYGGVGYGSKIIQATAMNTMRERYGVQDNISQSKIIQAKIRTNTFAKYKVYSTNQCPKVHEKKLKSGYRAKPVKVKGRVFWLQGYEPAALELLLSMKVPVWSFRDIPPIPYDNRIYLPDFHVGNLIIEVKSEFTAGLKGSVWHRQNLITKLKACRKAGYDFLLLIMNADGSLHRCCFNSFTLTKSIDKYQKEVELSAVTGSLV